ncbi:TMEM165/GDT1 family protein [Faecalispora jeddahensis]|uniref:TMEM165/GDT1 family protein n=1 Tax=Faecalispora jeddahensis TaxID=1414721 RepID=UPI0027B9B5EF|nr:TMEM165/GDT1 family protein [Faecalispora jeddahensis]
MGITALVFSLGAVVLAEMGDKTQLLAMAFAAKYKAAKVMIGVFLATILNHALAVAVGHMLTRFETIQVWIQGIAALSFIFFGLWTIRGDKLDGEENKTTKFGAIATVAIAFFIAEMGDKTQLTTVALAAKFPTNPLWILAGTTLGMLIADGIGIIIGVVLCKKIPERTVKLISAAVFIFFGFLGSYQVMRSDLGLNTDIIMLVMTLLYALTAAATIYLLKKESTEETPDSVSPACCQVKKEI